MTFRQFALSLAMTPGVGGRTVSRVMTRMQLLNLEPGTFFQLSPEALREDFGLSARQATAVASQKDVEETLKPVLDRLGKFGVTWATLVDAHYPERLEQFDDDPPGFLFLFGNTQLLHSKTFCVLSSRNSSPAALTQIEQLTEEGILSGEILVSGHNTPEYQRASIVPLRYGTPRILVLDRGLFTALGDDLNQELFPSARLWRFQFDARTDLVITPFRPEAGFKGVNNKIRDRVVAGLSSRMDCVEILQGGNMENLAAMALACGRPVRVCDRTVGARRFSELGAKLIPS